MLQSLQYFRSSIFYAVTWPEFKKKQFYLGEFETFKHIIIERRGFRGDSDEKMRRMWLGLDIVVAGLPPLVSHIIKLSTNINNFYLIVAGPFPSHLFKSKSVQNSLIFFCISGLYLFAYPACIYFYP